MERSKVLEVVIEGIQNTSSELTLPDQITEEHRFKSDLGCDSLDMVEIIMHCEKELKIGIPDDEAEAIVLDAQVKVMVDLCMDKTKEIYIPTMKTDNTGTERGI